MSGVRRRSSRAASKNASSQIAAILTPRKGKEEAARLMSLEHEDFDEEVDLDYEQEEDEEDEEEDEEEEVEDGEEEEAEQEKDDYVEDEDEDFEAQEEEEDDDDDDGEGDSDDEEAGGYSQGTNWVEGGLNKSNFLYLVLLAPFICQVLAYITSAHAASLPLTLTGLFEAVTERPQQLKDGLMSAIFSGLPTRGALVFLAGFNGLALLLEVVLPGKTEKGPETLTGHVPVYTDNGFLHCIVFSVLFFLASNAPVVGVLHWFDLGVVFDEFVPIITTLNLFGLGFSLFLYVKGLYFPSTADSGSSGSLMTDFLWGTELYPRILCVDIKRFINCRFSMTFWQLAGLCFAVRSYTLHGEWDWGLVFAAMSQYLYLVKFFWWEMGYMKSIDIIVDRAGFEIQWGCLVWVPAVYTLHTRFLVLHPSQLSFMSAAFLFVVGMAGVALNFAADDERYKFRESEGKMKVWGKDPRYVEATYTIVDPKTGKETQRTSLLLASGFWGIARHFHYVFELIAAWCWCLSANPLVNGILPLFYSVFLTSLLFNRAKRDESKCRNKYGEDYDEYSKIVPYLIIPGVY